MEPENALLSRRMFKIEKGYVIVEERWDLESPDCPYIRNPWLPGPPLLSLGNVLVRQVRMSEDEYESAKPKLKP